MQFIFDSHEEIRDYAAHTLHMVNAQASQAPQQQPEAPQPVQPAMQPQAPVQTFADSAAPVQPELVVFQPAPPTPPVQNVAPVQNAAPPTGQVLPTIPVNPEYDMDQLSIAMAGLVSQGQQPQIIALIQSFGVNSLVELPKEQYGALAVKLRELGAQL